MLIVPLGAPGDDAIRGVTRRNPTSDGLTPRVEGISGKYRLAVDELTQSDKRPSDLAAVLHTQTQDNIEDQKGVYDDALVAVRFCIFGVEVERIEAEGQSRERDGVALRDRSAPVVHKFLANVEVFVEVPPLSELGSRAKVVGHSIFPFETA